MALFGRNRQSSKYDGGRPISPEDLEHFRTWCATRAGIDGYVEPATVVNPVSLLLVDILGEYTRRPIGSWDVADKLGRELGFAVYAADETGYPRRMRERDEAMRLKQKRERRERMREEMRRLEQERNER
ncbi:MAG TPA: oxidoreductase [Dietzia timorensis]|uniref:Oxidoreductase n=1 Tax=Dietzia timorensis TaxID=499555 RepID=A0A921JZ01_9ACTN|nr:oxidoreductase [Dietzia timorensis]HJE91835.1 oxidoreductase [Dietzia timorensis]